MSSLCCHYFSAAKRSVANIFVLQVFITLPWTRGPHACETRPPNTPKIAFLTRALCSLRVLFQIVSLSLHDDSLSVTQQRLGRSSFAGFVDVIVVLFICIRFYLWPSADHTLFTITVRPFCVFQISHELHIWII